VFIEVWVAVWGGAAKGITFAVEDPFDADAPAALPLLDAVAGERGMLGESALPPAAAGAGLGVGPVSPSAGPSGP
jgi:hypothetical protein